MAQLIKQEFRQRNLASIRHQKEEDAVYKSRVILGKLLALEVFRSAKTIMSYVSFQGEVDTLAIIAEALKLGKRIAVPIVRKETKNIIPVLIEKLSDCTPGSYGILEPRFDIAKMLLPEDLDLVIVPGVAFDTRGNRLGRGAGYYDRFLSGLPAATPVIGLGFDFQITAAIPGLERHDRPVTTVLTN